MPFPLEFVIFALTLGGVAFMHKRALPIALAGLVATLLYEGLVTTFPAGEGLAGLTGHFSHEWVLLANLFLLLTGFETLASHFEKSGLPDWVPKILPDNWTAGIVLLGIIFLASAVIDNIAAAVIGSVVARHVFKGRVSIAYIAAIVGCSNAGGAGSVIGDTTTTMMWLGGVSPFDVLQAFVGAAVAFVIMSYFGARAQAKVSGPVLHAPAGMEIGWLRLVIVVLSLVTLVTANILANSVFAGIEEVIPVLGLAMWAALLIAAIWRRPDWTATRHASKGALFLIMLVATASLMPLASLPTPSWQTALGIGALSSVFDNIPLTALALKQGGYDWALMAFAVGFGGTMTWFGSSAGVAVSNLFPESRSLIRWVREAWFIPVAYLAGFFVMLAMFGWTVTPGGG